MTKARRLSDIWHAKAIPYKPVVPTSSKCNTIETSREYHALILPQVGVDSTAVPGLRAPPLVLCYALEGLAAELFVELMGYVL